MKDDNFYLCWSDLTSALCSKGRVTRLLVSIFAGTFLLFALFRTPVFVSEAVFQVKNSQQLTSGNVGGLIQLAAGVVPNQGAELTLSLIESRRISEGVIQTMGLQIRPRPLTKSLRLLYNLKDNLLSEIAWWTDRPSSVIEARDHPWQFFHVNYRGLYPKAFALSFDQEGNFSFDSGGRKSQGKLGESFCQGGLRFIVDGNAKALSGQRFDFIAEPMFKAYDRYKRRLSARMGRRKNGTIALTYADPSPKLSVDVTNALMHEYLKAAKLDAKRVTDEQIRLLARAQENAWEDLNMQYDAYADFTKESIEQGGFVRTKDALAMFAKSYGETMRKLGELERELAMLESADPILITTAHTPLQKQLVDYNTRLRTLNSRKSSLELALQSASNLPAGVFENIAAQEKEQQKRLDLMARVEGSVDKKYMQSLITSCNLRRRIYEAKLAAAVAPPNEIQGLGLSAATTNYERNLDTLRHLENQGSLLDQAFEQLRNNAFDTGALIDTVGVGPDFQQKVRECHALHLALSDVGNYSHKEHVRMREELKAKRQALKEHLQSVRAVNRAQQADRREWIQKAQLSLLSLVLKEISLVEEEMRRTVDCRRRDLVSEIESHKLGLDKIKEEMSGMPKAWLREKKLDLQTKFQSEMMRALVSFVESRQLSASLDVIESRPLDSAAPPIRSKPPLLVLWVIAGSLVGLVLGGLYALFSALLTGFSASRDNLSIRDQFVVGSSESDRQRALFYVHQKTLFCTGLDSEAFLRLVEQAKERGEVVKTAACLSDLANCDIELRRLHMDEIGQEALEGVDRLFVYLPKGPLSPQALSMMGSKGDWVIGINGEKVNDLAPYFEISKRSRVAFLLSSCR